MEPIIIDDIINYNKESLNSKNPKGEDFIDKDKMQSNDIFCLMFSLLSLCNQNFLDCFTHLADHQECLIKFNAQLFKTLFNDFLFSISDDKNLLFVIKTLVDPEKYIKGKIKNY